MPKLHRRLQTRTDGSCSFAATSGGDYQIREVNPRGYVSVPDSAVAPISGTVVDADTILFSLPIPVTHGGTVFYDIRDNTPAYVYLPIVTHPFPSPSMLPATDTRISDGDTILVQLDDCPLEYVRVRYIGVDTPERGECYWGEARDRNAD